MTNLFDWIFGEKVDTNRPYATYKGFDVLDNGEVVSTVWVSMVIQNGEEEDLEYHDDEDDALSFIGDYVVDRNMPIVKGGMDKEGRTFS